MVEIETKLKLNNSALYVSMAALYVSPMHG